MKLLASTTSPFARKCRITVLEKGLSDCVDVIWASPFNDDAVAQDLRLANPLNKIPTLVLDTGEAIFGSHVICEYLDGLSQQNPLLPPNGPDRFRQLTRIALADGLMEAAFNLVMEQRRPKHAQSVEWIERWSQNIGRAIEVIDWRVPIGTPPEFGLAEIGLACALDYLEFRLPDMEFLSHSAREWRQRYNNFSSLKITIPSS